MFLQVLLSFTNLLNNGCNRMSLTNYQQKFYLLFTPMVYNLIRKDSQSFQEIFCFTPCPKNGKISLFYLLILLIGCLLKEPSPFYFIVIPCFYFRALVFNENIPKYIDKRILLVYKL